MILDDEVGDWGEHHLAGDGCDGEHVVLQDVRLDVAQGLGRVGAGVLDAKELDLAPVEAAGIVEPGDPGLERGVDTR